MISLVQKRSLKTIFAALAVLWFVLTVGLIAYIVTSKVDGALKEYLLGDAYHLTEELAKHSRLALLHASEENIQDYAMAIQSFPYVSAVIVLDEKNTLFYSTNEYPFQVPTSPFNKKARIQHETSKNIEITAAVYLETEQVDSPFSIDSANNKKNHLGQIIFVLNKETLKRTSKKITEKVIVIIIIISSVLFALLFYLLLTFTSSLFSLTRVMSSGSNDSEFVKSDIHGPKEITEMSNAYNLLIDRFDAINNNLEYIVEERTVELTEAKNVATNLNRENRNLIQGMNDLLEEERKYIARELHDQLNSTLIAIKLRLSNINAYIEDLDPREIKTAINEQTTLLLEMIAEVYTVARKIIHRLRPEVIDTLGLEDALRDLYKSYGYENKKTTYHLQYTINERDIIKSQKIIIYRIVQESLNNIAKYAGAKNVSISLLDKGDSFFLEIQDDGVGFDMTKVKQGLGLLSIRERSLSLEGQVKFNSLPGIGTTITIIFPKISSSDE